MSKTEISAKIQKSQKKFLLSESHKAFQLTTRVRSLIQTKPNKAVQALACAIGFWQKSWILLKKLKNAKNKNYRANSPGPVCILQIFGNNPSRGFQVRAETSGGGGGRTRQQMQIGGIW